MLFAFDYLAPHLNVLKTVLGILLIVNAVFMAGLRRGVNTIVAAVQDAVEGKFTEIQKQSSYAKRGGLL